MDDRHARCIGPDSFMIFLLLGPFCVYTHTHCIRYSIVHLVSFVCYHVRVCWHGVLNFPRADRWSLFRNNPPRLIGGNVMAWGGHLSLWQAGAKVSNITKRRELGILWVLCVRKHVPSTFVYLTVAKPCLLFR